MVSLRGNFRVDQENIVEDSYKICTIKYNNNNCMMTLRTLRELAEAQRNSRLGDQISLNLGLTW